MRGVLQPQERRNNLRRLDDILEALEQLNLNEVKTLPDLLATRLVEIGIEDPRQQSIPHLIEKVWGVQQPFLITVVTERRRRRRRKADMTASTG
jgi:hypothetical protein